VELKEYALSFSLLRQFSARFRALLGASVFYKYQNNAKTREEKCL
jgi:hypothetical protein